MGSRPSFADVDRDLAAGGEPRTGLDCVVTHHLNPFASGVVRFNELGLVAEIPLTSFTAPPLDPQKGNDADAARLRVAETAGRFCLAWPDGSLTATDLTGKPLWQKPILPDGERHSAFDMTADGTVYVYAAGQTDNWHVTVFQPSGADGSVESGSS